MARSPDNGSPRDEQGRLIRFPRSKWVPDDGIVPLNADAPGNEPARVAPEAGAAAQAPAIDAGDFWASGETQQFVGADARSAVIETPAGDRAAADQRDQEPASRGAVGGSESREPVTPPRASERGSEPSDQAVSERRRMRLPIGRVRASVRTTVILALVSGAAFAGAAVLVELLTPPAPYKVARVLRQRRPEARTGSGDGSHRSSTAREHRRLQVHQAKPTQRRKLRPATREPSPQVASAASTSAPPVAPALASYRTGTATVAHGGAGGSSSGEQRAGPTGPVALIGAGTTPSG